MGCHASRLGWRNRQCNESGEPSCRKDLSLPARRLEPGRPAGVHSFIKLSLGAPACCSVCQQTVRAHGRVCRVCKFVCHSQCVVKVVTQCVLPMAFHLVTPTSGRSSETIKQPIGSHREQLEGDQATNHSWDGGPLFHLAYVTERIICIIFQENCPAGAYLEALRDVAQMLLSKHGEKHLVINLSENDVDLRQMNLKVQDVSWPDRHAPQISQLCLLVKYMNAWLISDPQNAIILNCKGHWGSVGTAVAAYMSYNDICSGSQEPLDKFSMKRFYDDKLSSSLLPSQKRYLQFFGDLLAKTCKVREKAMCVQLMILRGVLPVGAGCKVFLRVFQGLQLLHTSPVYIVPMGSPEGHLCVGFSPGLNLQGDILVKCFWAVSESGTWETLFQVQFHTGALHKSSLVLGKDQLEHAYNDPNFPEGGSVEFLFADSPEELPEVEGPLNNDPSVVVDNSMTDPFLHNNSHPEPGLVLPPHDVPTRSEPGRSTMETHGTLSVLSEHALSLSSDSGRSTASCRTDELRSPATLSSDSSTPSPLSISSTQPDPQGEGTATPRCSRGKLTTEQQDSLIELLRTFDMTLNSVEDTRGNSDDLEISPHLLPQSPQKVHFNDLSVTLERETDILDDDLNAANEVHSMGSLGTLSSLEGAPVSAHRKGSQDSLHTDSTGYSTVVEESNDGLSPSLLLPPAFGSSFSQGRMAAGVMNPRGVTIAVGQSALIHPRQTVKFEATAPQSKSTLTKKELGDSHGCRKEVADYGTLNEILSSPASIPTSKSKPVVPVRGKSSQQAVQQGIKFVSGLTGTAQNMRQDHMHRDNPTEYSVSQEEEELDQSLHELHKMIMDLDPTYIPPTNSACTHSPIITESCSSSPSVAGDLFQHRQMAGTCGSFSGLDLSSQCHFSENGLMPVSQFTSHSLGSASSSSYNSLQPPSLSRYHSLKPASTQFSYNSLQPASSSSYNSLRVIPPSSYNTLRPAPPFNNNSFRPAPPSSYNSLRPAPPSSYNSLRPAPPSSYNSLQPTPSSSFNNVWPALSSGYYSLRPTPPSYNMEPWQCQTDETLRQQSDQSSSRTLGLTKNQEASQISDKVEQRSGSDRASPGHKNMIESPSLPMKSEQLQPSVCKTRKQGLPARHLTSDIWHPHGAKVNFENSKPQQCNFVSTLGIQDPVVAKEVEKGNIKDPVLDISSSLSRGSEQLVSTDLPSPQSTVARMLPNSSHFFPDVEAKKDMRVQDCCEATSQTIGSGTNKEVGTNLQVEGKCSDSGLVRFVRVSPMDNVVAYEQPLEDTFRDQEGLYGCKETSPSSPNYVSMNRTIFKTGSFPGSRKVSFPNSFPHTLPRRSPGAPHTKALEWNSDDDLNNGITSTFVQDTSKFWYKPRITREQAIAILKQQPTGAFVIRDSTSFCGAFGLAMRVSAAQACLKHHSERDSDPIRHFLIESTAKGVQLKGSTQEPIFGSLSALIYQHSITALSLPCKLLIPEKDLEEKLTARPDCHLLKEEHQPSIPNLNSADCTSLYLASIDLESLTGPRAIAKAVSEVLDTSPRPISTPVFLRISSQGVTLTDNNRRLFFRKHYMANSIIYCSNDPEDRRWEATKDLLEPRIFGFIARKERNYRDNVCHLFAENSAERPASIIVSAIKDLMSQSTGE